MEKPKKYHQSILEFAKKSSFIKAAHYMMGYNRGVEESDKYYKRYIKEKCVKKKDLPDEEGWFEICYAVIRMSEFCEDWDEKALDLASSLAKQIVKRIGKEG